MSEKRLTIIIDGDMDRDDRILFLGSKEDIDKQPRNAYYFKSWEQFSKLLTHTGKLVLTEPKEEE